jgi:hypothetical protein
MATGPFFILRKGEIRSFEPVGSSCLSPIRLGESETHLTKASR